MRLTVTLTEKEAEVFFNMLAHSTNEVSDIDYNELIEIESKFKKAKEIDSAWVNNNINPYYKQNEPIVVELKNGLTSKRRHGGSSAPPRDIRASRRCLPRFCSAGLETRL
jgi:hypothetical protein